MLPQEDHERVSRKRRVGRRRSMKEGPTSAPQTRKVVTVNI